MVAAIRQRVTVQPGGLVEVRSSELTPGTATEVIVLVESAQPSSAAHPLAALDALQASLGLDAARAAQWSQDAAAQRCAFGTGRSKAMAMWSRSPNDLHAGHPADRFA